MKKYYALIATLLACLFVFSACSYSPLSITARWHKDVTKTNNISGTSETLVYSIKYDPETSSNDSYSLSYSDGIYTVNLKNSTYDWGDGSKIEVVYELTSTLTVNGTITVGESSHSFSDSITSLCIFKTVDQNLEPIYSEKETKVTSPNMLSPTTLSGAYRSLHYKTTATYDKNYTTVKTTYLDLLDEEATLVENTIEVTDDYTALDNEQLLFALRGVDFSAETTSYLDVLNAPNATYETVAVSCTSTETELLVSSLSIEGAAPTLYNINTSAVSFGLDKTMSGPTQTCYFATTVAESNTYRNVLVSMKVNLAYGLGSMEYSLVSADFIDN